TGHLAALVEEMPLTESCSTNKIELTNLRKLVLWSKVHRIVKGEMDAFVKVLSYCHNLTELVITANVLHHPPDMVDCFLEKIEQLPNLQRLVLHGSDVEIGVTHQLLQVCLRHPQLIDLQCNLIVSGFYNPIMPDNGLYDPRFAILLKSLQDADKKKSEAGEPTGLRLKSLKLPHIPGGYPQDFLFPFLRSHVPHLEQFCIPFIHKDYDSQDLRDAILEGCPRLQHITSDYFPNNGDARWGLSDIIRYCGPLGLKTFHAGCPYRIEGECQGVMQHLLDHHTATLEDFEWRGCNHNNSINLHSILAKCGNLKRFSTSFGHGITFEDAVSSAWVCHDITHLQLFLERRDNAHTCKTIHQLGKKVFAQIGALVKLEELSLGYFGSERVINDLTLEDGWLAELARLKKMRHFRFLTDYRTSVGQAEVEFMVSNWPKLEKITLDITDHRFMFGDVFGEPPWRWLKEKRPHIVLTLNK
ncbi:hypothetical protein BGX34_006604, partial [Mortierella sp. NVP85]